MPFTPFHTGPALLLGALSPRRVDLPTLLVASVVIDVRATLVVFGPLDGPVHGVLTTFLGATVVAALLVGVVLVLPSSAWSALHPVSSDPPRDPWRVTAAALAGTWSHVLLDAVLYADVRPFAPLAGNPFLSGAFGAVYAGCTVAGVVGSAVLAARFVRWRRSDTA